MLLGEELSGPEEIVLRDAPGGGAAWAAREGTSSCAAAGSGRTAAGSRAAGSGAAASEAAAARSRMARDWGSRRIAQCDLLKIQSVKLARKYLGRVSSELEATQGGPDEEELMLQGVRFAFRVHQFAGGFDGDMMRAFQEIKEKASAFQSQRDQQHLQQQKLVAGRS